MAKVIGFRMLDMLGACAVPPAAGRHCVGARIEAEVGKPCVLTYTYRVTAQDGVQQYVEDAQLVKWSPLRNALAPLGLKEWARRITIVAPDDHPATVLIERYADSEWLEQAVAALELGQEIVT